MQIQDTVGAPVPISYPHVLGSDAAGTVVKVGSGVTRFKEGDRVIG
jgi:NADPH:quinone reductase-like Zn-dependent oxidoreductase